MLFIICCIGLISLIFAVLFTRPRPEPSPLKETNPPIDVQDKEHLLIALNKAREELKNIVQSKILLSRYGEYCGPLHSKANEIWKDLILLVGDIEDAL